MFTTVDQVTESKETRRERLVRRLRIIALSFLVFGGVLLGLVFSV
jgi:hypothetical protein